MTSTKKSNFIILSLKQNILPIIFLLFTISLILFSKHTIPAVKSGLNLWANSVIPSLFPFFIATELLASTNIIYYLGRLLDKFMRPLFNVPGIGSFPLLMGIISRLPYWCKNCNGFKRKGTFN